MYPNGCEETLLAKDSLETIELILEGLKTQRFVNWYEKEFVSFIEGDDEAPSENEIKQKIGDIFRVSEEETPEELSIFMQQLATKIGGKVEDVWGCDLGVSISLNPRLYLIFSPGEMGPKNLTDTWVAGVYTNQEFPIVVVIWE